MNRSTFHELQRLMISSAGIIVLAWTLNFLSWKYTLVSSGLPGYALLVNYMTGFPVGIFLFIINSFTLLLSFIIVGKPSGFRGIYGYVLLSVVIDSSRSFFHIHQMSIPSVWMNILLITLQGAVAPVAIAVVLANKYSFGSYSSMYPVVQRFAHVSAPKFFYLMDFLLTAVTLMVFGPVRAGLLFLNATVFFVVFRSSVPFAQKHLSVAG